MEGIDPASVFLLILGGGLIAALVAVYKAPSERDAVLVGAQATVVKTLREENARLVDQVAELRAHITRQDGHIAQQDIRIAELERRMDCAP